MFVLCVFLFLIIPSGPSSLLGLPVVACQLGFFFFFFSGFILIYDFILDRIDRHGVRRLHPRPLSYNSALTVKMSTSDLESLRGSCSCGRNQYFIRIPDDVADHARIYFDDSSDNRTTIPSSAFVLLFFAFSALHVRLC